MEIADESPVLDFLRAALTKLRQRYESDLLPRGAIVVAFSDHGPRYESRDSVRWDRVVWGAFSDRELVGLPEATLAAEALWRLGAFHGWSVIIPPDMRLHDFAPWAIHALMPVLQRALKLSGDLDCSDELLLAALREHVASWQSAERTDEVVVPLFGFQMTSEELQLDALTSIKRLSHEDKEALWIPWQPDIGFANLYALSQAEFAIVTRTAHPRPRLNSSLSEVFARCGNVISALRLLKGGDVFSAGEFVRALPPVIDWVATAYVLTEFRYSGVRIGAVYQLLTDEEEALRKLYSDIGEGIRKAPAIALAIRRYNLADSREQREDKIIDLAITLEICLLHGLKDELSYRFVLRGVAVLSGTAVPEASAILKKLYAVRSSIVHDGKTIDSIAKNAQSGISAAGTFVADTRRITRLILGAYVQRTAAGESFEGINARLESQILAAAQANTGSASHIVG